MSELLANPMTEHSRAEKLMMVTRVAIAREVRASHPGYPLGEYEDDVRARDSGYIDHEEYRLTIPGLNKSLVKQYPGLTQKYGEMENETISPAMGQFLEVAYADKKLGTYAMKNTKWGRNWNDDEQQFDVGIPFPDTQAKGAELADRLLWRYIKYNRRTPRAVELPNAISFAFLYLSGVEQPIAARQCDVPIGRSKHVMERIATHIQEDDPYRMEILANVEAGSNQKQRIAQIREANAKIRAMKAA